VLILCDNTTERAALLGGRLCDNTPEKATLSCNMLWSQRPHEVVMSFTRSKPVESSSESVTGQARARLGRLAAI
jgi:hypothetical protein